MKPFENTEAAIEKFMLDYGCDRATAEAYIANHNEETAKVEAHLAELRNRIKLTKKAKEALKIGRK
jgi:hypothetical protein